MKKLIYCQISVLGLISPCFGQQNFRTEIDIEAFVEELFAFQDEDVNYEDLYETLLQVHLHPIDLQTANAETLQSLYILKPIQVQSFLNYRESFGPLLSVYELQAVPEWELQTIRKILPFITLSTPHPYRKKTSFKRILKGEDAYFLLRHRRFWQTRKGFTPGDTLPNGGLSSRYIGDPNDFYVRLRIQQPGDFSLGITADKDAGEQFTWDHGSKRYGFNFLSYHYTLYNKRKWKTISLGDYRLQFGQGLVFGSGFSVGKGAETISTVKRSNIGTRPYTSVLEAGFFRGATATYEVGQWQITGMYSNAPRDANIQTLLDSLHREEQFLSSLILSGLHRTPNEIRNKSQAREQNIGGNLHYRSRNKNFQVGSNHLFTRFSQPLFRRERIYNQFEFKGRSNQIHSLYFSYNFANHFIFGESALSQSGGKGNVLGIMSSLNTIIDFSAIWRKFDKNFHSFYGNAFAEGTRPINEEGLYLGIYIKPSQKFSLSAYHDYFKFPWMRFRSYAPSTGREWLSRFSYKPDKKLSFFIQWRAEIKSRNLLSTEQTQPFYQLAEGKRDNYVINLDFVPAQWWQVKSRVQFSTFNFNGSITKGYTIIQDINGTFGPIKFGGRIALFDTDDYENRQFVFEKNVLWAFSVPGYYGQGIRYYLLGQWKVNKNLSIWARWAKTSYTDRTEIGSGLQEIEGNQISETTLQLRYRLNK